MMMIMNKLRAAAGLALLAAGAWSTLAQSGPSTARHQIASGEFRACCGIAGETVQRLPDDQQAWVELSIDSGGNSATLAFLGQDQQVFHIPAFGARPDFYFIFTNGIVLPDRIQFGDPVLPPNPDLPSFSYVVTNLPGMLLINGTVLLPCPGCSDIPQTYRHTNVVAALSPVLSARVSEIEVCWETISNQIYQVQYRSSLTTNSWTDLGAQQVGTGSNLCIGDKVLPGDPRRFYRVILTPRPGSK